MKENVKEELEEIVKCFETGGHESTVVSIPKRLKAKLGIKKGQRFAVKVDEKGRLIYERING